MNRKKNDKKLNKTKKEYVNDNVQTRTNDIRKKIHTRIIKCNFGFLFSFTKIY